jgi:serine/threonine protein kinase
MHPCPFRTLSDDQLSNWANNFVSTMTIPTNLPPTASSAMPVGTRLGEFEITGVIGEGGFGIVYSAHDSSLDRIVAIKEYLPSAFSSRTDAGTVQVKAEEHRKTFTAGLASFINEARMLARFSHPGLVEVFRFWEANGTAYMAMRYYRGITMREMLRTAPNVVTEQWLCETLDPILLALKELHGERCYHRDIAPDNIMVLPNGRSILMDFGAARRIIGGMTQALTTVLKPGFAPIEQYSDDGSLPQGAWTDIYAVGGLLYHAMTGRVPVQAISRMMSDPLKPVAELARHSYSPQLCNAVMESMAVMPANRPQSVDELRTALGWVTTLGSTVIRPARVPTPVVDDYPPTMILKTASASTDRFPDLSALVQAESQQGVESANQFDPQATAAMMKEGSPQLVEGDSAAAAASFDPLATVTFVKPAASKPVAVAASVADASLDPLAALTSTSMPASVTVPEKVETVRQEVPALSLSGAEQHPEIVKSSAASKSKILLLASVTLIAMTVAGVAAFFYVGSRGDQTTGTALPITTVTPLVAAPAVEPAPVLPTALPVVAGVAATHAQPVAPATVAAPPVVVGKNDNLAVEPVGRVRIELKGGWGNVFVDGQQHGVVPPVLVLKLAPGSHEIELRNPGLTTVKRQVEVVAGKTVVLRHSFSK